MNIVKSTFIILKLWSFQVEEIYNPTKPSLEAGDERHLRVAGHVGHVDTSITTP